MRISTTDPITGNDIPNPESHPFIVDGDGDNALKIYFESEETKRIYLDIPVENPGKDFTTNLNNPA